MATKEAVLEKISLGCPIERWELDAHWTMAEWLQILRDTDYHRVERTETFVIGRAAYEASRMAG